MMEKISEVLHLGSYGIYVWPAFATAAAVLCWMAVSTLRRLRENERTLASLQKTHRRAFDPTETEEGEVSSP